MQKPLNTILVKPIGPDCNLNCDYCFYLHKTDLFPKENKHRMSDEVLEEMIKQHLEQSIGNASFIWQGGEPTLLGVDFFRKVIKLQKKYGVGKQASNSLQTNGLLITKEWASFFKAYKFLIGLSLDGPEHIHNKYRKTQGGKDSWEIVHNNAKMLIESGTEVNVLSCVTNYSSDFPEEIYKYFKSLGLNWMQFIPIVERDRSNPEKLAEFSVSPEKYKTFICTMFDLWMKDFVNGEPTTSIRYFDTLFYTYVGFNPPDCTLMKECAPYLVVEHDGSIYSCDFYVDPEHRLGNLKNQKLKNMLNSSKQERFGCLKSKLSIKCKRCRYLHHCYGGCLKDRRNNPLEDHYYLCEAIKGFLDYTDYNFKKLAEEWRKKNK